ncbi:hypothetical protein [Furfurilactobacillus milii]|uniref:hypothetical protein n=1 Tax=Furfurilactobacillus milii TaxID=2888272 RepID=UPI001F3D9FCF|nr:hypothetical protein [Furfurilactobacillus milii]MCF6420080.1 hypothetical protein [Furfurilactobacillus milii]
MTSNGGSHEPTPARHLHAIALVGFFIETLREWIVPIAGGVIGSLALYRKHPTLLPASLQYWQSLRWCGRC